jgi:hypothetical protein
MSAIDMLDEDPVKDRPIDLSVCGKRQSSVVGSNGHLDVCADVDGGFVFHSFARRQNQQRNTGKTVGSAYVSQETTEYGTSLGAKFFVQGAVAQTHCSKRLCPERNFHRDGAPRSGLD